MLRVQYSTWSVVSISVTLASIKIKIISPESKEIITDIDCECMQLKSGSCPATNPLGCAEKIVVIEEDLELSRSTGSIK